MSALIVDQLSFGWSPDELLLKQLSMTIDRERAALVGRNGVGKSTLIQLLVGELTPFSGHVHLPKSWLYLSQIPKPDLTVGEALGIDDHLSALRHIERGDAQAADYDLLEGNWDFEDRATHLLSAFDVPSRAWTDPLSSLSGGQSMRARLVRARLENPELLILDEPTNNLDTDGLLWLNQFISTWSSSLLVVSHERTLLSNMHRILELSPHGLKSYGGNYDLYQEAKTQERKNAQRRLLVTEKHLKHARREAQVRKERTERRAALGKRTKSGSLPPVVIGNIKRRAETNAGKSQGVSERQVSDAKRQFDQARQGIEIRDPFVFDIRSTGLSAKKRVLSVEEVTLQYESNEDRVLERFSFSLMGPERIAIEGRNGSGKSTLLKAIADETKPSVGKIDMGVERHAFLRQDASGRVVDRTLMQHFFDENPGVSENEAHAALARFGFRNAAVETPMQQLSGGERLRAPLAITLMSPTPPQLIILDEPANHMDLESGETLECALNGFDGALIVARHDRWFLNAIGITRYVAL